MGALPLVDERFGPDCGAGVPDVAEPGLVEADERDNENVALEPEDDPDGGVRLVRVGDAPQPMSLGLSYELEGGCLLGGFAVELSEFFEQCESDLLDRSAGFFDGREPTVEVLGPVQDHIEI